MIENGQCNNFLIDQNEFMLQILIKQFPKYEIRFIPSFIRNMDDFQFWFSTITDVGFIINFENEDKFKEFKYYIEMLETIDHQKYKNLQQNNMFPICITFENVKKYLVKEFNQPKFKEKRILKNAI